MPVKVSSETRAQAAEFLALFADEDAFRSWYDRALPSVYSFVLYRCGGVRSVALEITQEAFEEAVRSRGRFDGRSSPLTWVCGIARHRLADHFRRLAREECRTISLVTVETADVGAGEWEGAADARGDVLRVLRELPAAQASALALHYLDGLSIREIARFLHRTDKAVESLLARGRESFKHAYGGTEGDTGE